MFTPRNVGVSRRWRNSCGRMSPARWVLPFVCPFAWQSKQTTPRLGRRTAVFRLVELLLRKWRDKQPQAFELFRIENPVEDFIVVHQGHQLASGDIAQIRPCGQKDGRRELRQKMVRQIKLQVETIEITALLLLNLVDDET